MVYTTKEQVRRITNLVIADISDDDMDKLIIDAIAQLNSDINTRVIREKVEPIDDTRENDIDGSNTTYYIKNWKGKYMGDMNDDGDIDKDDVKVYLVASDGTETEATVSTVTSDEGKFVLSSAPDSSDTMYVTYEWCYENPDTEGKRIALACAFLTASFCYRKINTGMSPQQVYGNVRFMRDMRAQDKWYQAYENEVSKINGEMGDYAEAEVF